MKFPVLKMFSRPLPVITDSTRILSNKEVTKLVAVNKLFTAGAGNQDKIRLLGALTSVSVSAETLSTFKVRLSLTENYQRDHVGTVLDKMKGKDLEKAAQVATKTLALIETFFENANSNVKEPNLRDGLDILLQGISNGPNRCRFFQITEAGQLVVNAEGWAQGNGPVRSMVTSLSGMASFRDVGNPVEGLDDGFNAYKPKINLTLVAVAAGEEMKVMMGQSSLPPTRKELSEEDMTYLMGFEEIGAEAFALLKTTISFGGIETTFKEWGSKNDKCAELVAELDKSIKANGIDAGADLVTALNLILAKAIVLGEKFEDTRNGNLLYGSSGAEDDIYGLYAEVGAASVPAAPIASAPASPIAAPADPIASASGDIYATVTKKAQRVHSIHQKSATQKELKVLERSVSLTNLLDASDEDGEMTSYSQRASSRLAPANLPSSRPPPPQRAPPVIGSAGPKDPPPSPPSPPSPPLQSAKPKPLRTPPTTPLPSLPDTSQDPLPAVPAQTQARQRPIPAPRQRPIPAPRQNLPQRDVQSAAEEASAEATEPSAEEETPAKGVKPEKKKKPTDLPPPLRPKQT